MRSVFWTIPAVLAAAASAAAIAAPLSAPPVGPLPKGPVTSITAARGTTISIALKQAPSSSGLVWRVARSFNSKVVQQVGEGELVGHVVLLFRAVGPGKTMLVFGQTRGERPKAFKSATYRIQVR
jgi:hypothetical protein